VNTQIVRPLGDYNYADAAARKSLSEFSLGSAKTRKTSEVARRSCAVVAWRGDGKSRRCGKSVRFAAGNDLTPAPPHPRATASKLVMGDSLSYREGRKVGCGSRFCG